MSISTMARSKSTSMSETRTRAATSCLFQTRSTTLVIASLKMTRLTRLLRTKRTLKTIKIKTRMREPPITTKGAMSTVKVHQNGRMPVSSRNTLKCQVPTQMPWATPCRSHSLSQSCPRRGRRSRKSRGRERAKGEYRRGMWEPMRMNRLVFS